jgi:hypothetical protein
VSLCVISKNLKNEEAIARDWAASAEKKKFTDGIRCNGREDIYCGSVLCDMTVPRKCQEITGEYVMFLPFLQQIV